MERSETPVAVHQNSTPPLLSIDKSSSIRCDAYSARAATHPASGSPSSFIGRIGPLVAQSGSAVAQTVSAAVQFGSAVAQTSSAAVQFDSTAAQFRSTAFQSSSAAAQSNTAAVQSISAAAQSDSFVVESPSHDVKHTHPQPIFQIRNSFYDSEVACCDPHRACNDPQPPCSGSCERLTGWSHLPGDPGRKWAAKRSY